MTKEEADQIKTIAANIEHLLAIRSWTWSRLATESGVAQPTLSRLKNAKYEPGVFTIRKIAAVLDTSMEWLCERHESKFLSAAS